MKIVMTGNFFQGKFCAFFLALSSAFSSKVGEAAVIRHLLGSTDSSIDFMSLHSCGAYLYQPSPHWCQPALLDLSKEGPLKADAGLSADKDAFDFVDQLLNQPVTKEFLESLFRNNSFQSFSGFGRIEALGQNYSVSFLPVYVAGGYRLSNPTLPELNATGVKSTELRVTAGHELLVSHGYRVLGGISPFYFDSKYFDINVLALDLAVKKAEDLVQEDHVSGVDLDAGLAIVPETLKSETLQPALSFEVSNACHSSQFKEEDASGELSLRPMTQRRYHATTGGQYRNSWGHYYLGVSALTWGEQIDPYGQSLSLIYGIGRLRSLVSYSQLLTSFGFLFMAENHQIGIQYTSEKQINAIEIRRHKNVNLFASFNF
jgi:hypothetical protein